jgi:hypothetical protein
VVEKLADRSAGGPFSPPPTQPVRTRRKIRKKAGMPLLYIFIYSTIKNEEGTAIRVPFNTTENPLRKD